MILCRKLIQYARYKMSSRAAQVVPSSADSTSEMLEERIQSTLNDMDVNDDDYVPKSEAVKNLCEAVEKHDKMLVEREKISLQIAEAERRRVVDWGQMTPKIVSIIAYSLITCVLLALERQTPLSMRWLKALDALLAPKGI